MLKRDKRREGECPTRQGLSESILKTITTLEGDGVNPETNTRETREPPTGHVRQHPRLGEGDRRDGLIRTNRRRDGREADERGSIGRTKDT